MIPYKEVQARDLTGTWEAEITHVEVEPNQYYDPTKENSTEYTLSVTFQLEDPENPDYAIMHPQRFISPLTGGKGLFQGLLDAMDELPDKDGGEFDEQRLVGLQLSVTIGKNNKGYNKVEYVEKLAKKPKKAVAKKEEEEDLEDFLKED